MSLSLRRSVPDADAGHRLDDFVQRWLEQQLATAVARAAVRRAIMAGAVTVDGQIMRRPGSALRTGATITIGVDPGRLARHGAARDRPAVFDHRSVLFDDGVLLAVAKPPGIPIHPTADPARADFYTAVRRWLRDARPDVPIAPDGLPQLGLHHRLDVDTSGVVLFNIDASVNARLTELFSGRGVTKIYHALTAIPAHRLPASWTTESNLASGGTGRTARVRSVRKGGKRAVTVLEVLEQLGSALLVEARPESGRKHQVRAHLSEAGLPILGDVRYGGQRHVTTGSGRLGVPRVMLHARGLSLPHPGHGGTVTIKCPYPPDYDQILQALRGARRAQQPAGR